MNTEFHYYITGIIAHAAGFSPKEAKTIATAFEFDEDLWFDEAIETKVRGLKDSKKGLASIFCFRRDKYFWREDVDKEKTDWFCFQEAVKAHQTLAMEYLKTTFDKMGIDLHQY